MSYRQVRSAKAARELHLLREHSIALLQEAAHVLEIDAPPLRIDLQVPNAASNGIDVAVNPIWIRGVLRSHGDGRVCSARVILGVLAHELAHHILHHMPGVHDRNPQDCELEADYLAGYVLGAVGATPQEFQTAFADLSAPDSGYCTPPAAFLRVDMIRAGYKDGRVAYLKKAWCTAEWL